MDTRGLDTGDDDPSVGIFTNSDLRIGDEVVGAEEEATVGTIGINPNSYRPFRVVVVEGSKIHFIYFLVAYRTYCKGSLDKISRVKGHSQFNHPILKVIAESDDSFW